MITKILILPLFLVFLLGIVALVILGVLVGLLFKVAVFVLIILGIVWLVKEIQKPRRRR